MKLVFQHLEAIREIDRFVRGDECVSEVKVLRRIVEQELSHAVFEPAGWVLPSWKAEDMFTNPAGKWKVWKSDAIGAVVGIPTPVNDDDYESYVGIYVPEKWKGIASFSSRLKTHIPKGFDHVANHPNEGFRLDYPMWKYIPYAAFAREGVGFDLTAFLRALTYASRSVVAMEKRIDRLLADMG